MLDQNIHPSLFKDEEASDTPFGKAVSLTTAAQCAEDPERGRVFIQGLYRAINDQLLLTSNRPINILYAGTGPFAWLVLPLLTLFSDEQVQLTLLDIHQTSLDKVSNLFNIFGFNSHVSQWVCADATAWQPDPSILFDLIVSETMKHLLQQEPQVQIFSHLQQYLATTGQLIPRDIILEAWLEARMCKGDSARKECYLAPLFSLNRTTSKQLAKGEVSLLSGELQLPHFESGLVRLKLTTKIQVYDDCWLQEGQCQLTLSQYKQEQLKPLSQITYQYIQGTYPDFIFNFKINDCTLAKSDNLTCCGVYHLKRLWDKAQQKKRGIKPAESLEEWTLDNAVFDVCGIGLEPGIQALYQSDSQEVFSTFVEAKLKLGKMNIQTINQQLISLSSGQNFHDELTPLDQSADKTLSAEQLDFWQTNGYLIIPQVLTPEQCSASRALVWQSIEADENDAGTWYHPRINMQKIMLQLFRDPTLDANRKVPKIKAVFEQLWGRNDLVMTTDRVSFNPPETDYWRFPGPDMHWDAALTAPIPFATQGLIYLTDTSEQQGAFCCVPGFHLRIDAWLEQQGDINPQDQNWSLWPIKYIAANAGDLIIWHHALPHGASANRMNYPRIVQYINCYPIE